MRVFWKSRAVMAARDWFFIIEESSPGAEKTVLRAFFDSNPDAECGTDHLPKMCKKSLDKDGFQVLHSMYEGAVVPKKVHIDRTMGSGETAAGGAEGERRSSQAKGPVPDDTPKRPGSKSEHPTTEGATSPAGKGISQVTLRGHKTG